MSKRFVVWCVSLLLISCSGDDEPIGSTWDTGESLSDAGSGDIGADAMNGLLDAAPDSSAETCAEGSACDDGDRTTANDTCSNGECSGDPIVCTLFQCIESSVPNGVDCDLTPKPAGAPCNDGDSTTVDDVCDGSGACAGESVECVPMQCDETAEVVDGECVRTSKANGSSCNDGDLATGQDQCTDGVCSGTAIVCVPGTCEASSTPNGTDCDVVLAAAGTSCDDMIATTRLDVCDAAGECAGTAYTCTPGECEASSVPNGTDCTVTFKPMGTTCDDSNMSTRDDVCDPSGSCAGTPYNCTPGTCESASFPNGVDCTPVYEASGTSCDDGALNTRNDVCDGAGSCAGEPYTCPSAVACQLSNNPNGVDCTIVNLPDGSNCSDNETCTVDDACIGGVCVGQSLCGNGSCDAICGENAGTCSADCLTTVGQCAPGDNSCTDWPNCHSTTAGNGLCANIGCGNGSVGDCFCDPTCIEYGDCCQDMQAVCGCP